MKNPLRAEIERCIKLELENERPTGYSSGLFFVCLQNYLKYKNYSLDSGAIQYIIRKYKILKRIKIETLKEKTIEYMNPHQALGESNNTYNKW